MKRLIAYSLIATFVSIVVIITIVSVLTLIFGYPTERTILVIIVGAGFFCQYSACSLADTHNKRIEKIQWFGNNL